MTTVTDAVPDAVTLCPRFGDATDFLPGQYYNVRLAVRGSYGLHLGRQQRAGRAAGRRGRRDDTAHVDCPPRRAAGPRQPGRASPLGEDLFPRLYRKELSAVVARQSLLRVVHCITRDPTEPRAHYHRRVDRGPCWRKPQGDPTGRRLSLPGLRPWSSRSPQPYVDLAAEVIETEKYD